MDATARHGAEADSGEEEIAEGVMRRIVVYVCMPVLVFAVAIIAQTQAPKPGPEHQKVRIFVGHWTYEGVYKPGPWGPGGKATGEETVELVLGGFFVQGHVVEKGASGETRGFETFGYNPATNNYLQSQYMDDGSMASGAMTVNGNTWDYSGITSFAGKQYKTRYAMTFATDLMSMVMKMELSADGNSWTPFGDFKFTKVKPAPKK
jgi:hypothetical protein